MKSDNEIVVNWDDNVGGWHNERYNIEDGHGEYVYMNGCDNIKKIKKVFDNYKLVITCEDEKHTNAKYYINNKLVSESKTSCNEKYDDFNFKTAVDNCVDRMDFTDKTATKGRGLIGRKIKKGQRIRIINVEPHRKDEYVCLNEYVGKEGIVNYDYTVKERGFLFSVTFDKEYMNAIDRENGCLRWRWDEIELID